MRRSWCSEPGSSGWARSRRSAPPPPACESSWWTARRRAWRWPARQGADDVVDFTQGNPVDQVLALVGEQEIPRLGYRGGNVDAVIDCAGAVNSSQQGLQMLKQENGRLVLVALFEHDGPLDRNVIVRKHVRLLGSWAWTTADIQLAAELVGSGKVDRKPLVSHQFALDQAAEAFAFQEKGQAIKVVINP